MAAFECGIEYQNGRGQHTDTALECNQRFSWQPACLRLFQWSFISSVFHFRGVLQLVLQDWEKILGQLRQGLCSLFRMLLPGRKLLYLEFLVESEVSAARFLMIFLLILMGYAVIKVFFANLKRGGILLIQIAVGSLYLFSVPRGYIDGFVGWCKQVIGLCLTAFLQATVLIAGLMVVKDQALLGLGLMLSAGEIPRIAGQFGLETGTKANVMGAVYAAQGAMNLTRTVVQVVSK